ncbi:MAG TPA: mechanosensitive ion channel family protein [Anaerolineales bacterium]|nr:mechanosensitive ion channel family protein [Anaerolineales bacterium]
MSDSIWISVWRVGIAVLLGLAADFAFEFALRRAQKRVEQSGTKGEGQRRIVTLLHAARSIGRILILLIVVLMILHEVGLNIAPVLASAGVAGLAFSLAAQTLIKDYLGGVILLIENEFTIGDIVAVGGITGTVERISLRATYLRDVEGKLILIPNGDIRSLANLTAKWAKVLVTFNVDYETDSQRVLKALEEAVRRVQADDAISGQLVEAPQVLGWSGFSDWAVQMQVIAKSKPGEQWAVARALRKAALECLQQDGLQLATPRQRVEVAERGAK